MQLWEAIRTDHYLKRKAERGTIKAIELPEAVYGDRNKEEVDSKLISVLQKKLNENLTRLEVSNVGRSNNVNLGVKVFIPQLVHNGKKYDIGMINRDGGGTIYLVIVANDKALTIYPTYKSDDEQILITIEDHLRRERPEDLGVRPPDVYTTSYAEFLVDIDGNKVIEKEEKPEIIKASETSLPYRVRTDYRKGSPFDHRKYGKGIVIAAAGGGKGGSNGVVDWIEVKYDEPFLKGGTLQDTRRFENIFTNAYFGKTLKGGDMPLEEKKGTCCGKCGHVHVKGTSCPKPFLTGKHHCSRRTDEMHTMVDDGADEFHQVRADVEESIQELTGTSAGVEAFLNFLQQNPEALAHLQDKGWYFRNIKDIVNYIHEINHREFEELKQDLSDFDPEFIDETDQFCEACLMEYLMEYENKLEEAEYRGRKVSLGKPFLTPGGPKKRSVYVKNAKGNVVKVNFGDPNMKIKKSNPARRRSFRARHKCSNPGPRWKARYWSCKAW